MKPAQQPSSTSPTAKLLSSEFWRLREALYAELTELEEDSSSVMPEFPASHYDEGDTSIDLNQQRKREIQHLKAYFLTLEKKTQQLTPAAVADIKEFLPHFSRFLKQLEQARYNERYLRVSAINVNEMGSTAYESHYQANSGHHVSLPRNTAPNFVSFNRGRRFQAGASSVGYRVDQLQYFQLQELGVTQNVDTALTAKLIGHMGKGCLAARQKMCRYGVSGNQIEVKDQLYRFVMERLRELQGVEVTYGKSKQEVMRALDAYIISLKKLLDRDNIDEQVGQNNKLIVRYDPNGNVVPHSSVDEAVIEIDDQRIDLSSYIESERTRAAGEATGDESYEDYRATIDAARLESPPEPQAKKTRPAIWLEKIQKEQRAAFEEDVQEAQWLLNGLLVDEFTGTADQSAARIFIDSLKSVQEKPAATTTVPDYLLGLKKNTSNIHGVDHSYHLQTEASRHKYSDDETKYIVADFIRRRCSAIGRFARRSNELLTLVGARSFGRGHFHTVLANYDTECRDFVFPANGFITPSDQGWFDRAIYQYREQNSDAEYQPGDNSLFTFSEGCTPSMTAEYINLYTAKLGQGRQWTRDCLFAFSLVEQEIDIYDVYDPSFKRGWGDTFISRMQTQRAIRQSIARKKLAGEALTTHERIIDCYDTLKQNSDEARENFMTTGVKFLMRTAIKIENVFYSPESTFGNMIVSLFSLGRFIIQAAFSIPKGLIMALVNTCRGDSAAAGESLLGIYTAGLNLSDATIQAVVCSIDFTMQAIADVGTLIKAIIYELVDRFLNLFANFTPELFREPVSEGIVRVKSWCSKQIDRITRPLMNISRVIHTFSMRLRTREEMHFGDERPMMPRVIGGDELEEGSSGEMEIEVSGDGSDPAGSPSAYALGLQGSALPSERVSTSPTHPDGQISHLR